MSDGNGTNPEDFDGLQNTGPGEPARIHLLHESRDDLEQAVAKDSTIQMGVKAMRRPVSRGEAVQFITTAALAMGQKIYDQIAEEHARVFAEMEKRLSDRIAALEAPKWYHVRYWRRHAVRPVQEGQQFALVQPRAESESGDVEEAEG